MVRDECGELNEIDPQYIAGAVLYYGFPAVLYGLKQHMKATNRRGSTGNPNIKLTSLF